MDIALISYWGLPEMTEDDQRLLEPLRARGLRPQVVRWNDPDVDWARFRLALVRTTWDYFLEPVDFLAWLERVPALVDVLNPPDVLRWNSHKSYLLELAGKGIPVTPTVLCPRGGRPLCRRWWRSAGGARWW